MIENKQQHIEKIKAILTCIRSKINDDTDVVWTKYDTPGQLIDHIDVCLNNLKELNPKILGSIYLDFSPTSTFQEISISNGWEDEYIQLSTEFDNAYKKFIQ